MLALPLTPGKLSEQMPNQSTSTSSIQEFPSPDRPVVLLVMDEAMVALDVEWELDQAGCGSVGPVTTCDGAQAWLDCEGAPDAAVVSFQLSDCNSDEILDQLLTLKVPVLLFTALPRSSLPTRFEHVPLLDKSATARAAARALTALLEGAPKQRPYQLAAAQEGS